VVSGPRRPVPRGQQDSYLTLAKHIQAIPGKVLIFRQINRPRCGCPLLPRSAKSLWFAANSL